MWLLWCLRVPKPSSSAAVTLFHFGGGCHELRSSIMASQSIEVRPCRNVLPKGKRTVAVIMWWMKLRLFRRPGPVWNLNLPMKGSVWSGHCWCHEKIFKARAEAKQSAFAFFSPSHSVMLSPASRRWLLELLEILRLITPTTRSAFSTSREAKSHEIQFQSILKVIPKMDQKLENELNYLTTSWLFESCENRYHCPWWKISYQVSLTKVYRIWVAPMILWGCHCASRWFAASVDFSIVWLTAGM